MPVVVELAMAMMSMMIVLTLTNLAMMMIVAVMTYVRTYGDDGYVRSRLFPVT